MPLVINKVPLVLEPCCLYKMRIKNSIYLLVGQPPYSQKLLPYSHYCTVVKSWPTLREFGQYFTPRQYNHSTMIVILLPTYAVYYPLEKYIMWGQDLAVPGQDLAVP